MDLTLSTPTPALDFNPDDIRAEIERADELAKASPASQAACDVMSLVRRKSRSLKTLPLRTRFRGAGATTDEMDRWWANWGCNGESFELYLSMHGPFTSDGADGSPSIQIHGDGFLSLEVGDEQVMALRVELRCDDPEARIRVVGATEFVPGPWTDVLVELHRRLAEADTQTTRKAA